MHKNLSEARVKSYLKIKEKSTVLEHRDFKFYGVHNDTFDFIKKLKGKVIPVDLLFFECDDNKTLKSASAFEIKMGGNLDTKNSKSNANEVADLKRLLGFIPLQFIVFCHVLRQLFSCCSKRSKSNFRRTRHFKQLRILEQGAPRR